jgi:hypothetical protein
MNAGSLSVIAHSIQQHGLTHAAQADHQNALGRPAGTHARDTDAHDFEEIVSAGKFGRR